MSSRLLWKLLAINIPVIAAVILVLWLTIDFLAADYFSALMHDYNIAPAKTHQMFLDAVHRYLVQASIAALVVAAALSFLFTRRVLRPLSEMAEISRLISAGDYRARVRVTSGDEVGHLGDAFNGMADSLERVETLRRRMVGDIAHELRTPLTTVRGYLEGATDGIVPLDGKTLEILQSEIMRLVRLVDDLHQLNKVEAARAYLRREPVPLSALVRQAVEMDRPEFESRDIGLEFCLADIPGTVRGDPDKILQILRNLVQNAWQYTPEGGLLQVGLAAQPDGIKVTFTNSGAAIPREDLPHIFERFYRVGGSRSRESGGTGIGLAIVRELVEAHGGSVGAESVCGETRIWFTLPE